MKLRKLVTRWTCQYKNCALVRQYFITITSVLQNKVKNRYDENAVEAEGIRNNCFEHLFNCCFVISLFICAVTLMPINILRKS